MGLFNYHTIVGKSSAALSAVLRGICFLGILAQGLAHYPFHFNQVHIIDGFRVVNAMHEGTARQATVAPRAEGDHTTHPCLTCLASGVSFKDVRVQPHKLLAPNTLGSGAALSYFGVFVPSADYYRSFTPRAPPSISC